MYEVLKQFFGEDGKTAIDYDTLVKGLQEKSINLDDVSKYVSIDKYQEQVQALATEKENAKKYKDYDDIVKERDELKAEKANNECMTKLETAKILPQFRKFVLSEIQAGLKEGDDFDEAVKKYASENKQYVEAQKPRTVFRSSNDGQDKGTSGDKTVAEKMNNILKGALK